MVDDIFNTSLDGLADLPAFVNPKAGIYEVTINGELVPEKKAVKLAMTIDEIIDMDESAPGDVPKKGDLATFYYRMDNEYGQSNLKRDLQWFIDADLIQPNASVAAAVQAIAGVKAKALLASEPVKDKETGETRYFVRLKQLKLD